MESGPLRELRALTIGTEDLMCIADGPFDKMARLHLHNVAKAEIAYHFGSGWRAVNHQIFERSLDLTGAAVPNHKHDATRSFDPRKRTYALGERVHHPNYGNGVVVHVERSGSTSVSTTPT